MLAHKKASESTFLKAFFFIGLNLFAFSFYNCGKQVSKYIISQSDLVLLQRIASEVFGIFSL